MKILCTNFFVPKKGNLGHDQVRLLRCEFLRTSSSGVVAFPGSPGRSSPPGFLFFYFYVVLLRIRGFCDFEFENSAQQQPVWSRVFVVSLYFEFISRLDALHSVLNILFLQTLPMSKLHQQNRLFFRGVMTPTLLPVRPGLHSTDVGLLSVCQCHCHCHRQLWYSGGSHKSCECPLHKILPMTLPWLTWHLRP